MGPGLGAYRTFKENWDQMHKLDQDQMDSRQFLAKFALNHFLEGNAYLLPLVRQIMSNYFFLKLESTCTRRLADL